MPLISVVIPLYNKANLVEHTLGSVLAQTFTDYEIVVIDDGSTDGSAEVVEAMSIPNLRLIRQQNTGVSAARNRGIEEAEGKYIALLDADDEWKPEYLATQVALTEKYPECEVFATNYEFRDALGNTTSTIIKNLPFEEESGILSNYFKVASTSHPPLWTSAVMATKKSLLKVECFPVGIKSGEDLLTWARLAVRYKIAYTHQPMSIFSVDGYNITEKPRRVPSDIDIVGISLKELQRDFKMPCMRKYRSLWHKMRASNYMRLGRRKSAFNEIVKAVYLNPINYKLYLYLLINLLPTKFQPF